MDHEPLRILLIEDNPVEVVLLGAMLAKAGKLNSRLSYIELTTANGLEDGIAQLTGVNPSVILLDLGLPDSNGLETLKKVHSHNSDVPIVILTADDDESLAVEAMQCGAQDYLVKGQYDVALLSRSIRYAMERHNLLRQLSLIDELTGLYNRRGFLTLAEQALKSARRSKRGVLIFYGDMDGLKGINDQHGHRAGSDALVQIAEALKSSFRASDIIARLGGDEFAILAIDAGEADSQAILERLQAALDRQNDESALPYKLKMSVGVVVPAEDNSLSDLLSIADERMYMNKRERRGEGPVPV